MDAVKHIFGFILLGMAIYFAEPLLPKSIVKYALPVFMLISGIILLFLDKEASKIKGFRIFKVLFSGLLIGGSVYLLIPSEQKSPDWQYYSENIYQEALRNNDKLIIDFYAVWFIPCKKIIRKKINIRGMPTVLIINSEGTEVERITGFVNAAEFLKIIEGIK